MNNLYLDVHVLQTVPPSCMNRDDNGSPKTAVYGGVPRVRVSSQAWKHAMREKFLEYFDQEQIGVRTKYAVALVAEELTKLGYKGDTETAAKAAVENAKIPVGKENELKALFYISHMQAKGLAQLVISGELDKVDKKKKENIFVQVLAENPSIDIVLFGRMVAKGQPSCLNVDAAVQVAHSISTHEARNEYDFFTAVDDFSKDTVHMDTIEFCSATLYRYATVNVRDLKEKLKSDTTLAVKGFVKAFMLSMPSGKQNTFANRTVPDFAYITIRTDQPVNLAGAFEKPVRTLQDGYVEKSVQALKEYALKSYESFVHTPTKAYCIGKSDEDFGQNISMDDLMAILDSTINEYCRGE